MTVREEVRERLREVVLNVAPETEKLDFWLSDALERYTSVIMSLEPLRLAELAEKEPDRKLVVVDMNSGVSMWGGSPYKTDGYRKVVAQ
jgi:hypothetical protein